MRVADKPLAVFLCGEYCRGGVLCSPLVDLLYFPFAEVAVVWELDRVKYLVLAKDVVPGLINSINHSIYLCLKSL